MTKSEDKDPKYELTDIRPGKVSLVDLGANDEKFFIAKGLKFKQDGKTTELAKSVDSYLQGIAKRVSVLTEWLKSADGDDEVVIPHQVTALLKSTSDYVDTVKSAFSDNDSVEGIPVPGDVRDKMVTMLDVVTEKVTCVGEEISKSEDVSDDFMSSLNDIASALGSITEAYNGILTTEAETSKGSEGTMSERIKSLIKSATKPESMDAEHIKKQAGSAVEVLQEVIATLDVNTNRIDDLWDLRWRIGDAISMLIDAAALDSILGPLENVSDSQGGDRDEKETEMSTEKTDKSVEEEAVKSSDSSEGSTEKDKAAKVEETEESIAKAKAKPAPVEDATSDTSASDKLAATIAEAVTTAMGPVREAVDTLQEAVQKQAEHIEKMDNDRAVAKGAGPDETQGNTEGDDGATSEPKSAFTEFMPPGLRGRFVHGEKVED
jgi:tetrahydromethanopterin S-methyltransferase subunit B